MLSLRTTAITQQPVHCTEATVLSPTAENFTWSEAVTTPWEGLHFRSNR